MHYTIDAQGKKLGRLASEVAHILQGKKNSSYERNHAGEDTVSIKNASRVLVTGRKTTQKIYYHHTGYMGHLRSRTFATEFKKSPEEVLRRAVYAMLPKNWLRQRRLNRLHIER